ncbi:hypothetical protein ACFWGD_11860 [Corynebacterium sp. NPDC060344]|uniref:hypothetical protein n=1 Tax=Corynebacterium sp. NPDC060344 TaxID=3347101 RepID=UPI003652B94A
MTTSPGTATQTGRTTQATRISDRTTQSTHTTHPTPTFAVPDGAAPGPLNLLGAELGRLLNLRSTWGYIAAMLAFLVGLPVLMWLGTRGGPAELMYEPTFPQVLLGADIVVIIAMVFAAAGSASDISGRRVAFGYLTAGTRPGVHVARLAAQVTIVAATILAGVAIACGLLAAVGALVPEDAGTAAATIGILLLWTAIGSAVGMLVPVTAIAVGLPIAWIMVIEIAVSTVPLEFLRTLSTYLPWVSSRQLIGMMDIGVTDLHAGIVLAAWSVAIIGGGILVAARRDVK